MDDIAAELQRLASQENCDGEPYDQMVLAADEIQSLRAALKEAIEALDYAVKCINCGMALPEPQLRAARDKAKGLVDE